MARNLFNFAGFGFRFQNWKNRFLAIFSIDLRSRFLTIVKLMLKNKKLFYGILIVVVLVAAGIGLFLEIIPEEERGYYGFSTFGPCQNDQGCFVSGCNSEICQSKAEEPMVSICIAPDRPTPPQLDYGCGCRSNRCQWIQ
jgi:eight-cysteine-cluster-containing protein